jgi:alpha-L-fucosidase 2
MYARLHDAAEALKHLRLLYAKSTLPNLFDNHPPFQIDGNFGGCAAIAEMLVQSHERPRLDNAAPNETFLIDLMPAWPAAFAEGYVSGLRCRGAVDLIVMRWSSGQPTEARFRVGRGTELVLRLPEGIVVDEATHRFAQRDREVVFQVNTGDEVKVQFAVR